MWSLGQNLGQVRFNVVRKQRNWHFSGFFIFCMRYARSRVVIEIPEWKLKAKLARNTIFEGN